jgi:hypothetical protein
MPKRYEYFGLIVLFYANEHEPVHVHAKYQGREGRADLVIVDGRVKEILFTSTAGRAPLTPREMQYFEEVVRARSEDIIRKWIDFFVLNKSIRPERIARRLK